MNVVKKITRYLRSKTTLKEPTSWLVRWFGGRDSPSGLMVSEDDMLKVSAVFACVNLISNTIASLPLPTYRRLVPRGKERAHDHHLYDLLAYEPNPEMSSFDFRKVMQSQLELYGNCYTEIVRDGRGYARELWPIPPQLVKVRRDGKKRLFYEVSVPDGPPRDIWAIDMLHIRGLGNNGIQGFQPLVHAREMVALALAAEGYGAAFFGNGAVASGIVEMPGKLTEKALEDFKRDFRDKYQGLGKAHRILFLEQGLKFHQVTIPNDNAQFLETRKYQVEEVARFFGVPPHKIADLGRSTNNNIEHQGIEYVQDCIRPRVVNWEQQIRRVLIPAPDKKLFFVEFVLEGLLRGDVKSRAEYFKAGRNDGWLSANDIRELENMNPISAELGGDDYLINGNMVPISQSGRGGAADGESAGA